jgi:putative FmdB family regulatory protein
MPIYEYECTSCGEVIEVMQKVSARAPGRCKKCSGKLKKKISVTSFQLKGGGWYSDGYSEGGSKPADAAKPDVKKTDAKPAGSKTKKKSS